MPTFATPEPITVSIELSVGDVRIVATDRTDTVVQVRPSDDSRELDVRDAEQTRVEQTPDGLVVKTPRPRGLGLLGKPGSVDGRSTRKPRRRFGLCSRMRTGIPRSVAAASLAKAKRPSSSSSPCSDSSALPSSCFEEPGAKTAQSRRSSHLRD
jgi:hypothetical protein